MFFARINRQLINEFLLNSLNFILSVVISFFSIKLFLLKLDKIDYSLWIVMYGWVLLFASFDFGVILFYQSNAVNKMKSTGSYDFLFAVKSFNLVLSILMFSLPLLVIKLYLLLANQSTNVKLLLIIMASLLVLINILSSWYLSFFRIADNYKHQIKLVNKGKFVELFLLCSLYFMEFNLLILMLIYTSISVIKLFLILYYLRKSSLSFKWRAEFFSFKETREVLFSSLLIFLVTFLQGYYNQYLIDFSHDLLCAQMIIVINIIRILLSAGKLPAQFVLQSLWYEFSDKANFGVPWTYLSLRLVLVFFVNLCIAAILFLGSKLLFRFYTIDTSNYDLGVLLATFSLPFFGIHTFILTYLGSVNKQSLLLFPVVLAIVLSFIFLNVVENSFSFNLFAMSLLIFDFLIAILSILILYRYNKFFMINKLSN